MTDLSSRGIHHGFAAYVRVSRIVYLLLIIISFVALVDGWVVYNYSFNRLETLYFSTVLLVAAMRAISVGISYSWFVYFLSVLSLILFFLLFTREQPSHITTDLVLFARSYVIAVVVYACVSTSVGDNGSLYRFMFAQWLVIVLAVLLHKWFSIGGVVAPTGKLRGIYSSYFQEANVISYVLVVSWFFLYVYFKGLAKKLLVFSFTFYVVTLLSSKAAMLLMFFLVLFHILWQIKVKSYAASISVNIIGATLLLLLALYFDDALSLFTGVFVSYFPDGLVLLDRIERWDLITALSSARDLKAKAVFDLMDHYDSWQIMFGVGYANVVDANVLVESDFIDILHSLGVFGLFVYITILVFCYRLILSRRSRMSGTEADQYVFFLGVFYATIIMATLTGHVLTNPMAMMLLGVVYGFYANHKSASVSLS